ncbi:MAG TPA: CPBP family glutamic-type intramembrane protease [Gemmatimonadales bacterium]|nr:CPBP family glutamic-type intramembrane protease [Gemmatimonadales bacterium]
MKPLPQLSGRQEPFWLLLVATLVLFVFYYLARADVVGVFSPERGWFPLSKPPLHPTAHFVVSGVLLGLIPVLAARWLTRSSFKDLGLGLGRWRLGVVWLAIGIPLAVLAGWISAPSPELRAVYPLDPTLTAEPARFMPHALRQAPYFFAWEVLFRGVILFGLRKHVGGATANAIQTALSVLAHFGRPMEETLSAIPAGLVFGAIDLRVGSIWYVAIIHWVVGVALDWWIVGM